MYQKHRAEVNVSSAAGNRINRICRARLATFAGTLAAAHCVACQNYQPSSGQIFQGRR